MFIGQELNCLQQLMFLYHYNTTVTICCIQCMYVGILYVCMHKECVLLIICNSVSLTWHEDRRAHVTRFGSLNGLCHLWGDGQGSRSHHGVESRVGPVIVGWVRERVG